MLSESRLDERGGPAATIDTIPIIDAHCHAFVPDAAANELVSLVTLSEEPLDPRMIRDTLLFRHVIRELATVLGCEPDLAAVTEVRRTLFERDRDGYFRTLFEDAGIEALLCDVGHPVTADGRPAIALDDFAEAIGRPCYPIFRVEIAAERQFVEGSSFGGFLERFDAEIDDAVAGGAVALKSVIAYRSGLDVELTDEIDASRSYDRSLGTHGSTAELAIEKPLWDFLFVRSLRKAIEHAVPLQVHTGMGDGPIFDMTLARPVLLRRVLFEPSLRRASIVLTHAGYPWVEESGWLANQYENVHIDVSEMVPFAAHGMTPKLLSLLEMTPTSKLMIGTDGFNAPEVHWFGAKAGRRSLASALETLHRDGWLAAEDLEEIARAILHDNAARLYRLEDGRGEPGDSPA